MMKITLSENAAQLWLSIIDETKIKIESIEVEDGIVTMEVANYTPPALFTTLQELFEEWSEKDD